MLRTLSLTSLMMSVLLTIPATAFAATPDEEQPIHITADALDIQDNQGISVYTGHVEVTQGSLTLFGDKITIRHPKRQVESIKVVGTPAKFKRFDAVEQRWINGEAKQIDYQAGAKTVLLTGDAKVEQPGKNLITGPKLFYDLQNKTLQAQSTPQEKKRISVTLMPEKDAQKP